MRNIQELLCDGKTIWFYLRDQENKYKFAEELNQLGAKFLSGSLVTAESCSSIMAVHPDLKVTHLMIMIWNASFSPSFADYYAGDVSKILKVDFAKYIAGSSDYFCQRSEFSPVFKT